MIPKIINYCWFGGKPLPQSVKHNIETWEKFCPEYQIVQWNEKNFDINKFNFSQQAYDRGKWAFVSDVARLEIVYENGGIYLDTDVELLQSLDDFLKFSCFLACEDEFSINTGLGFGAERHNSFLKENLDSYKNINFLDSNGNENLITCVEITTGILARRGFKATNQVQQIQNSVIFPTDFFCPQRYGSEKVNIQPNTVSWHHYDSTWTGVSKPGRFIVLKKMVRFYVDKVLGTGTYSKIKKFIKN